jgi:hypothetical protein
VTRIGAPLGPVFAANTKLAELMQRYVIVDAEGQEMDGKLAPRKAPPK